MEIKRCQRCRKEVTTENEIGVRLDIYAVKVENGYIGTRLAKDYDRKYLPLTFSKSLCGEVDLCSACLDDFLNYSPTSQ